MQSFSKSCHHTRLVCGLAAIMVNVTLCGCPNGEQSGNGEFTSPFAEQIVTVHTPETLALQAPLEPVLEEWSARTGASARSEAWQAESAEQLARTLRTDSGQHLALVPLTWLPDLQAAGRLRPLPETQLSPGNLDWLDVLEGLRSQVLSVEDQAVSLPVACPTLVCYYRSDLLAAARLEPPETWQDYLNLVQTRADWAGDLPIVEPWHESFRATMYLARAVCFAQDPENFSLFFDIASGAPLIDQPGFGRGLEISQQILAELPAEVAEMTPAQCRDAILSGRAAMTLTFEPGISGRPIPYTPGRDHSAPGPRNPSSRDDSGQNMQRIPAQRNLADTSTVDFCLLPGSTAVFNISSGEWREQDAATPNRVTLTGFGGACLVLVGGTEVTDDASPLAAFNLLRELSLQQLPKAFGRIMPTLCRKSQFTAAASWLGDDLTSGEKQAYLRVTLLGLSSRRCVVELPVIARERFRASLTDAVSASLFGDTAPDAALADTRERWQAICDELGPTVVRDSYRQHLGLSPLQ